MNAENLFKYRQFPKEIIILPIRRYLRFALSYRDVQGLLLDRKLELDHTTIYRWVQRYAPELNKKCRKYLRQSNDSYRVDETCLKIKGITHYLYRAIDSVGDAIKFMLFFKRNTTASKQFFYKVLMCKNASTPRVIVVDKG